MLSTSAWNAFLKTLEEPPTKSIFILCTTNPEKIPATILSRVQRYNFQRISHEGICKRLLHILECEDYIVIGKNDTAEVNEVVSYLAKMADGGMRDAITLLDKILSYSDDLSMKSVLTALGAADYDTMYNLTYAVCELNSKTAIEIINEVFNSGVDLKQFIKDYFEFVLDINTYWTVGNMDCVKIPTNWKNALDSLHNSSPAYYTVKNLLEMVVNLMNEIKWVQNPKSVVIARFILFINKEGEVK
jgi:DNA polymerase-3 subunit gamma/tau